MTVERLKNFLVSLLLFLIVKAAFYVFSSQSNNFYISFITFIILFFVGKKIKALLTSAISKTIDFLKRGPTPDSPVPVFIHTKDNIKANLKKLPDPKKIPNNISYSMYEVCFLGSIYDINTNIVPEDLKKDLSQAILDYKNKSRAYKLCLKNGLRDDDKISVDALNKANEARNRYYRLNYKV